MLKKYADLYQYSIATSIYKCDHELGIPSLIRIIMYNSYPIIIILDERYCQILTVINVLDIRVSGL